jgi:hypothetical protein
MTVSRRSLLSGLSRLPGTAASAALKPLHERVPSQKGFVVRDVQKLKWRTLLRHQLL